MEAVVASYDQVCTPEVSLRVMQDLAREHADRAGRFKPQIIAALVACALTNNDPSAVGSLVSMELSYRTDDNPEAIYHARSALALFQKAEFLDIGCDKEAVAWGKFVQSERDCLTTNQRLTYHRLTNFEFVSSEISAIIHMAQKKISRVLGSIPKWDDLDFSFGPGANTTVKASRSSPRFKLGADLACSKEFLAYSGSLLSHCPAMCLNKAGTKEDGDTYTVPVEIHAGKLQFVPKNAKTYRSIVVEPLLNSMFQKGVGKYLRKRLLRIAGVNLRDQSKNQRMALKASIDNLLATVDFSAASDTISREVVALLLPEPWFNFLSQARTGSVVYKPPKGEAVTVELQKFSSMGNAYTFELESLIFWALASATKDLLAMTPKKDTTLSVEQYNALTDDNVSAYGDDVILPTACYPLYREAAGFLGFTINNEKSFVDGPFRESCGADWYQGFAVRPFYLKELLSARLLFVLHNNYMRNFEWDLASKVLALIDPSLRLFGPDGYGDGHLLGSWSPKRRKQFTERGYEGCLFETYVDISESSKHIRRHRGDWILPSYSAYVRSGSDSPTDIYALRGVQGFKRISIYTLTTGIFVV